jgi:hypothetical protein
MTKSLRLLSITAAVAAVALGSGAARALACGNSQGYSSTRIGGSSHAFGISAQIAQASAFDMLNGSLQGWVMVGGKGEGPLGSNEWLQAGLAGFPNGSADIYYEVAQPGRYPTYHQVSTDVAVGTYTKVTVLEMRKRPNLWRVWVNHKPVSPPILLPQSHNGLKATAKSVNWDGGTGGTCNDYAYSFRHVALAGAPGGDWQQLTDDPIPS